MGTGEIKTGTSMLSRQGVLEDLDSGGRDINILSQDEGYIVWTDWADPKMEELSSGTIVQSGAALLSAGEISEAFKVTRSI